jgi:tetratricopeptide (TPR) repeat protein
MSLQRKLKRKARSEKQDGALNNALLLYRNGRYQEAESACNRIIVTQPKNVPAHQILGMMALNRGQFDRAVSYFTTVTSLRPSAPDLYCNLGIAYRELGSLDESRKAFLEALQLDPHFFKALYNIGILEQRADRLKDSLRYLSLARDIDPANTSLVQLLADTHLQVRNPAKATEAFELFLIHKNIDICKLAEMVKSETETEEPFLLHYPAGWPEPDHDDISVIVQLANLYMRSRQSLKAKIASQIALHADPNNFRGNLVFATIDRQNGKLEKAAGRLQHLEDISLANEDHAAVLTELGRIYDLMGKYEKAFSAIEKAHQIMAALPSSKQIDRSSLPLLVQQCSEYCARKDVDSDSPCAVNDTLPSPLFLVGFPRSGTTLTEQIIRSQLDIQTSDEFPVLHQITFHLPRLLDRPFSYPNDLHTLSGPEIHYLRKLYWQRFQDALNITPGRGKIFLDKLPLNILHLVFIEKIFPEARVIVALRDPRDVCLSNFMQLFRLNDAMIHFLELTDSAQLYARIMRFWLFYRRKAGVVWHETRYEDLVFDPENTVRKLVEFSTAQNDLPCFTLKDSSSEFSDQVFSTPSYYDVTQPIYSRAIGRWKNYAKVMAPTFPILEEFVTEFGYEKMNTDGIG